MTSVTSDETATDAAASAPAAAVDARTPSGAKHPLRRIARELGMVYVLIATVIAANIIYPQFLDAGNLQNILSQNAPVGIIAVGMTFVMIAGGFDLSVGAIYAFGAVIFADMANSMAIVPALAIALALGCVLGAINGLLVTKLKVNTFVATLGTASVFGGAAYLYSHSAPIVGENASFGVLGNDSIAGLAISIWLLIAVLLIGGVVLARTVYGRSLYSIGGNDEASRLAGLPIDRYRASTYVVVGACSALAGAIIASRLGVGQADVGNTVALDAIAVVVIGGTSLFGGEGAIWRTGVGLLILAVINNVADSEAWDTNSQSVIKGGIVIAAVAFDAWSRRRRSA